MARVLDLWGMSLMSFYLLRPDVPAGRSKLIASERAVEFFFDRDEILREYSSRLDGSGEIVIDL